MIRYLLAICAALALSLLTGCAGQLRQSAHGAIAADAATTIVGVGSGLAQESNPLISSPGALLASVILRAGAVEYINTLPEPQRTTGLSAFNGLTWGVVASNLVTMALHSTPVGLAAGVAVGWQIWRSTADERVFAAICADEKTRNPALVCVFRKGA